MRGIEREKGRRSFVITKKKKIPERTTEGEGGYIS
jgi:hypothetical protein